MLELSTTLKHLGSSASDWDNAADSLDVYKRQQEYAMLLTTRATKALAGRYGGLENLGEKLMKAENFEMALDLSLIHI